MPADSTEQGHHHGTREPPIADLTTPRLMEITTTAAQQIAVLGMQLQSLTQSRLEPWMVDLQAVQLTAVHQCLDALELAIDTRMGQDGNPASGANDLGDLAHTGEIR